MYKENQKMSFELFKGISISLIFILVAVLIFALVNHIFCFGNNTIFTVNQIIKVGAIFLGCFLSIREKGGIYKGIIIGAAVMLLSYLIFSVLSSEFSFGLKTVIEFILALIVGAISGIISVNSRN